MHDDSASTWHFADAPAADDQHLAIKKWEKLRLLYNALLIPWTLLTIMIWQPNGVGDPHFMADVIAGGLIANISFCLGPVLEMYLVYLGANTSAARIVLFGVGTAFTALAALIAILTYSP